jgi:hypothetical protein
MTDQEFLDADFDVLLQSMTLDEINARHESIDAGRETAQDAMEAAFLGWTESRRIPYSRARRRCLECAEWLAPESNRCTECGAELPIVTGSMRTAERDDETTPQPRAPSVSPVPRAARHGGGVEA